MSNQNPQNKVDLSALRLPQNFGEGLGVRKVITRVPVQKPNPDRFFCVHPLPAMQFTALIYEDSATKDIYIVMPELVEVFGRLARRVTLHLAVDRSGNPFLLPVPMPSPDGTRNSWPESLAQAVERAKVTWVRVVSNRAANMYDVLLSNAELPQPEWPDMSIDELVLLAFSGKIVDSLNHLVIQRLQGKI